MTYDDNPGLADTDEARAARARIRGKAKQRLWLDRARGNHSQTQHLKDHHRAQMRAQRNTVADR